MKQNPDAFINTAKKLAEKGKLVEARRLLLQQLQSFPGYSPLLNQLSIVSYQLGDYNSARKYCTKLLLKNPESCELHNRLGQIYYQEGDLKTAETSCRKAISLDPANEKAHYLLGKVYYSSGRYADGLKIIRRSIDIKPDNAQSYLLAANIFSSLNEFNRAKAVLADGLKYQPANRKMHFALTKILFQLKDFKSVKQLYQSQLKNDPENYEIMLNMGLLYNIMGKKVIANEWFFKCMNSYSTIMPIATLQYAYNSIYLCQWDNYDWLVNKIIDATKKYIKDDRANYDLPIYILMYFDVPRKIYFQAAKKVADNIKVRISKIKFPALKTKKTSTGKIKLGYISPKFRKQAGGLLYYDIFRHHNRDKFEIFVYSLIHKEDFISRHIRNTCDHFFIGENMTSKVIAEKIRSDDIDILVTTAGYYDNMRMDILAFQPAPIQIIAQGYNESTGSDFIQYAIVDQRIITLETPNVYTEKLIILPDCAMINSPLPESDNKYKNDFNLPEGKFVYASFNRPIKITRNTIKIWANILHHTETSIIWIYDNDSIEARQNILKEFEDQGIDRERIYFTGMMTMENHWTRFQHADLYLDCFQYNAHVTAIEALRSGLPVLTLRGNTHNSRYAASILKDAGLDDFICTSEQEYLDKAIYYFNHKDSLDNVCRTLKESTDIQLFNTSGKVHEFETAFLKIWERYCAGEQLENIVI